jgi:hypothetical protein
LTFGLDSQEIIPSVIGDLLCGQSVGIITVFG